MYDFERDLRCFTGSETLYNHPLAPMRYTDGVRYFADRAGAYWFVDIVATQLLQYLCRERFISIHLRVADGRARIAADDGDGNEFYARSIDCTDCPEGDWGFYLADSVLMLPSEY